MTSLRDVATASVREVARRTEAGNDRSTARSEVVENPVNDL